MENRTPDLVIANDALYQLSYDPTRRRSHTTVAVFCASAKKLGIEVVIADCLQKIDTFA